MENQQVKDYSDENVKIENINDAIASFMQFVEKDTKTNKYKNIRPNGHFFTKEPNDRKLDENEKKTSNWYNKNNEYTKNKIKRDITSLLHDENYSITQETSNPFSRLSDIDGNQQIPPDIHWWFSCKLKSHEKYTSLSLSFFIFAEYIMVRNEVQINDNNSFANTLLRFFPSTRYIIPKIDPQNGNNLPSYISDDKKETVEGYCDEHSRTTKHLVIGTADKDKRIDTYADAIGYAFEQLKGGFENMESYDDKLMNYIAMGLCQKKQIVLTGAPGTGKTFSARQYAETIIKEQEGLPLAEDESASEDLKKSTKIRFKNI